ncbi:MAG: histidine--tRNA ligase [Hyphomicrobiales bacterium]|nr:histidine--tRNA ligase [Hyphomicrobiales bacterium]
MSGKKREIRPKPRLPKGMRDIDAAEIRAVEQMLGTIRQVYESYGFEPLDTPAFEYTDTLGKFLPDQDRPNEGVFSFQDEDEQWLSLRYDLTAPLARFVAQNYDGLPKPFRRYQTGPVWRNEKPGPGRFRQFTQFDADTVGTDNVAADAELCMLAADTYKALGVPRGSYTIRVNNRKILDGIIESAGIDLRDANNHAKRLTIMRAIDKLDRLGLGGVEQLLGEGRKDESGDYTKGAGLEAAQIAKLIDFITAARGDGGSGAMTRSDVLNAIETHLGESATGRDGLDELRIMDELLSAAGIGADQIAFEPAIVRGLEYYTGPVFEAELTYSDGGDAPSLGSVGSGGRYDGLVARFKGVEVPATGFSVGVSRLYASLQKLGKLNADRASAPAIILVMDKERTADYYKMASTLRVAGIRAEMYLGTSGMKAQMKYADKRGAPCVIIQGGDEKARGEVTIKDMILGEKLSQEIADNQEWREGQPAQFSVKEGELVEAVASVIARHGGSKPGADK